MDINSNKENNCLTITLNGRLDTNTAPQLDTALKEELGDIEELILDFENLEYISSAGLRVVLAAQKIMNKQGNMKVLNVQDMVMEVLEATGFTDFLTIE